MIARILAAVVAGLLLPTASTAQQAGRDPNCEDDRGIDRCSEEQQRRTRVLFGVRSIEEHRSAGDEVRRIFYVDGYGRDMIVIAFVRAAGRDPTVWVHHPEREGEGRPEPLQAPVPLAVWNDVIERSANFHRSFAEPPRASSTGPSESELITACLHSWVYTMEAVDRPPLPDLQPQIRRKTEDACENGPGESYAQQLGRIARSLFPHCAALDLQHYRSDATALTACRILRGDRQAAAEALNQAQSFVDVAGPEDAWLIAYLFDHEATIEWAGESHRGSGRNAGEFWGSRIRAAETRALLYFHSVEGVNADHVRLTGSLSRSMPTTHEEEDRFETATVEQIWTRVNGGRWLVERATVGPWQPER